MGIVAVLGRGVVPADEPLLHADDLGVLRGDGVFETVHVRDGVPWNLTEHLDRMRRSADRMDLDLPPHEALRELAGQALAARTESGEAALRLICTRGREYGGAPTVFATLNPITPDFPKVRRDGVRLMPANIGYPVHPEDVRAGAPWLLGQVKSLSYAINMAGQRAARAAGFDDLLWISADGWCMEASTASLMWIDGDVLYTVPPGRTSILPGTTSAFLMEHAADIGLRSEERMIRPDELFDVDGGVWVASSVRGVAPVVALGERTLPVGAKNEEVLKLAGFPVAD
ncbi:aminotransferase class IV [Phytomonospora sp. NPDC050363]|uniref:aminotransferase class IV n=1 Tax=Phytomonospora sp. NPDC050363 TaxID=3155642 RepID=UPI00340FEF5D